MSWTVDRSNTLAMPSLLAVARCLPSGDTAMAYSPSFDTYKGVAGPLWGLDDNTFNGKLLLLPLVSFPCNGNKLLAGQISSSGIL